MSASSLIEILRGPFVFLRPSKEEIEAIQEGSQGPLPWPQRIFLRSEDATPAIGFPILQSPATLALREAASAYVSAEEELELGILKGHSPNRRGADAAWEYYRKLLQRATENAVSSSFGRHYPSIFWLFHSIAVSRLFKESPMRLRRLDLGHGRAKGDEIKYRVFHRYLDRVLNVTYEVANRVARETEEAETALFPTILSRMRDNVLIFTEDHVSRDLRELTSYLNGYVRLPAAEFRQRLGALEEWHAETLERDAGLQSSLRHLLGTEHLGDPWELFLRPGYAGFLSNQSSYDEERLLPHDWIPVWEGLLGKLKEFELLAALRRFVVPTRPDGEELTCSAVSVARGAGRGDVVLSSSTRPLDFMTPWVVDPLVRRFGLIYDITDFSAVISSLRRAGNEAQDQSFRRIFTFQRRVNRMAQGYRLKLEKYLGDGAFYSGRFPFRVLAAAIRLQRYYRRAVEEDFPFDRGMRLALNYGRYRLLPIEGGERGGHRYEFFGHGIVELSRLVTGKTLREIEDVKTLLISRGYAADDVEEFFAPVARQNVYLVDKLEEARQFYAYITPNGVLVNEGIVATQQFIRELDRWGGYSVVCRSDRQHRHYIAVELDEEREAMVVGFRKLGRASLKGLGRVAVYEIVDATDWPAASLTPIDETRLEGALDSLFDEVATSGAPAPAAEA